MTIVLSVLSAKAQAQVPNLPEGSQTRWVVDQPQEIVAYVVFDPAVGKRELPQSLRFINPRELATAGIPWAAEHLPETARRGDWILRKGRRLLPVAGRGGFP